VRSRLILVRATTSSSSSRHHAGLRPVMFVVVAVISLHAGSTARVEPAWCSSSSYSGRMSPEARTDTSSAAFEDFVQRAVVAHLRFVLHFTPDLKLVERWCAS